MYDQEYAGGVFGDVDVEVPASTTDIGSQFTTQTMQPSVASALQTVSQIGTQQAQQIQAQQAQQAFMQQQAAAQPKPSMMKAAMPWLIGGLAIAGVAAAIVFLGKKKDGDSYEENPKPRKKGDGLPGVKRCPVGTEVQTLILDAGIFDKRDAVTWAREHDFKAAKVHTTGQSHRIRQHLPTRYRAGSFKTITLTEGVKAVIGCPR